MSYNWFNIDSNPPKITDWLQGIGALIATVAAIIGFVKLFKRDRNREKEIKSLAGIADAQQKNLHKVQLLLEESQKQTQEFIIQSNEMRESNTLYKKHLDILSDSMADNKTHQRQLIDIQKAQRKNEILPRFKFSGAGNSGYNFDIQLQLVRNIAYFESVENDPESGIVFRASHIGNRAIGTNETISLNGTLSGPERNLINFYNEAQFKFDFLFRNKDRNLYKQVIQRVGTNYNISPPEEVAETP